MGLSGHETLAERRAHKYQEIKDVVQDYILNELPNNDLADNKAMERIINIMLE